MPKPDVFNRSRFNVYWEEAKEKTMFDKFKELHIGYKIGIFCGAVVLLAVAIYVGVDPLDDFGGLND